MKYFEDYNKIIYRALELLNIYVLAKEKPYLICNKLAS